MSSTSPEDGASAAGLDWAGDTAAKEQARPPPRKRRRIVISCTECHRRKQKCDRKFPCTNCVSRNKDSACRYETGAPTAKQHGRRAIVGTTPSAGGSTTLTISPHGHEHEHDDHDDPNHNHATPQPISLPLPSKAASFGYSHTGANTLGFLHHIETATPSHTTTTTPSHPPTPATTTTTTSTTTSTSTSSDNAAAAADTTVDKHTRDRYKTLIRQLPARCAIEKLAALYFAEFNPHYAMLDRDVFDAQLAAWYRLPFSLLSTGPGPQALGREMRAFPAVVFQVCAVALLVVDDQVHYYQEREKQQDGGEGKVGEGEWFEGLKYAGGMTFEDLAREYSDCGVEVLAVLGKRGMGVNTVVAGWMRASWLKYVGLVTESWHAVGSAIRDAQEIGLHRDSLDPKPSGDGAEAVLENQWEVQRRRKTWMTLVMWDVHMACCLGRPTTTDLSMAPPSLPVDAPVPKDWSKTPVLPRGENDPPTPLTRSLWTHCLARPMREIMEMEKDGPCPKDFARVDRLHNELLDLDSRTPSYFRLENPDTRFDALPECSWLPLARVILPQMITFELMALHRPYIFTRPKSRTEALKASLDMLHAQRLHFMALKPQMYKTFSLFFGTFDAIVLMASIYILFPKEHPDMVQRAIQHFHWAVERFEAMSARNPLAKAALGVLHAICLRMTRSLGLSRRAAKLLITGSSSTCPASGTTNSGFSSTCPAAGITDGSVGSSIGVSPSTTASFNPSPSMNSRTSMSTATTSTPGDGFSPPQQTQMNGLPHRDSNSSGTNTTLPSAAASSSNPTPPEFFNLDPDLFAVSATTTDPPFDWNLPSDFDWASLQPIYATSDLLYHNLSRTVPGTGGGGGGGGGGGFSWGYHQGQQQQQQLGYGQDPAGGVNTNGASVATEGDMNIASTAACPLMGEGEGGVPSYCRFGGDFGDDSVWNLLNQYTPAPY